MSFSFTKVPAGALGTTFKSGKLNVHTHTNYTAPKTDTTRAQLYFDNDIKFNPTSAPKCNTASAAYMNAKTLKQAMAACGSARWSAPGRRRSTSARPGTQPGVFWPSTRPSPASRGLALFVSAIPKFLQLRQPREQHEGHDRSAGVGHVPRQSRVRWGPTSRAVSELDFDGSGIPSAAPLSDFNVTLQKGTYVQAKCGDSNKLLNMRTVFTYTTPHDPNPPTTSSQTVLSKQTCT